ncbi:MAG: O-acetyl-ADP-ribose deacetylase [Planctomycetota bacterium]
MNDVVPLRKRMSVVRSDITSLDVDAIVNAANESLLGGGGVDGAIHMVAGPELLRECEEIGGCETGAAVITGGYKLAARHVIHTVGPIYRNGMAGEADMLASCYASSLDLAAEHELQHIAFSCISTGVYGYPRDAAALVAVQTVTQWLLENEFPDHVTFCCFHHDDEAIYQRLLSSTH